MTGTTPSRPRLKERGEPLTAKPQAAHAHGCYLFNRGKLRKAIVAKIFGRRMDDADLVSALTIDIQA
jgi:hypothetical protein